MLDYSGCVLYNWALLDEKGPCRRNWAVHWTRRGVREWRGGGLRDGVESRTRAATPSSRRRVDGVEGATSSRLSDPQSRRRGVVLQDPFGHRGGGGAGRSRIERGRRRHESHSITRLNSGLPRGPLSKIEDCFGHVVRDCLPLMFERHGQHGALCDYYFFYARLRPFINGLMLSYLRASLTMSPCPCRGRRAPCLHYYRRWMLFWACPTRIGRCKRCWMIFRRACRSPTDGF